MLVLSNLNLFHKMQNIIQPLKSFEQTQHQQSVIIKR